MKSPLEQLQASLNAKVKALGLTTYDGLPVGEVPYPFVVFDNESMFDISPKDRYLTDILYPLYIWSDYTGSLETKQIVNSIIAEFIDKENFIFMPDFTCEQIRLYEMRTRRYYDTKSQNNKQLTQAIITLRLSISENV